MIFRKRTRPPTDPSFLFSTWPIPSWDGHTSFIQLEPSGGDDTPQMQKALARLSAISGSLRLIDGVFRISAPIDLSGTKESLIVGNVFLNESEDSE